MKRLAASLLIGWLPVAVITAADAASNVQFSAQAVQTTPDKKERNARIYVGDNRVRLEYEQQGEPMVEIYDMKNNRALLLMPQQSAFMQRSLPEGGIRNPMLPPSSSNPCLNVDNARCQQVGSETLFGLPASKWEMTVLQDEKELKSLHWIDERRLMPLRQLLPDGTVMEMQPAGQETLGGRATEHWDLVTTRPDGESFTSKQWYDPELRIAIREELPGGFFRELRDIRIAPQPVELFQVPRGFRQMEAPQAGNTAPQQGRPQAPQQGQPPAPPGYRYPGR